MSTESCVLAEHLAFPEGPAFAPDGALWCVELRVGNLVRWQDGQLTRFPGGGEPNGLAFDASGDAWVCDAGQGAIRRFSPAAEQWSTVVDAFDGVPLARPNDLAFDAAGNLVFTCPGDSRLAPDGYVCCLRFDGSLRMIARGMHFPNGLAFVSGGRSLVVAETYARRLWIGDWDPVAGEWLAPHPWAELGQPTGPDGIALGADRLLYVAGYCAGQIRTVSQEGRITGAIDLPGQNPTNCAFDPSGRLGLVVTEAEKSLLLSVPWLGPGSKLFTRAAGPASAS